MDAFFTPSTIALIGASAKVQSIGHQLFTNLLTENSPYKVYAVNPNYAEILGQTSYNSINHIIEPIDLAIIAVSSKKAPKILEQCGKKQVKAALVVAAGFRETGIKGVALEHELLKIAKKYGIRLLGTHSIGYILPHYQLNASFLSQETKAGNIAFISQSGALCNAILNWSARENIGFSAFVSLGTMIDVEWADIIAHLADDYRTHAILIYMESIGDARRFITAAREVAFSKPIILIKAGRTQESIHVAAQHSGKLPGNDIVLDAAFRRSGVLKVERIAELFFMASVLSKQPLTKGNRLAIVTNAGGPAILATDILIEGNGVLSEFTKTTIKGLRKLPNSRKWMLNNPLDLQYHATVEDFATATDLLLKDKECDGLLVILSPQLHCSAIAIAHRLVALAELTSKPLMVSILGGEDYEEAHQVLIKAGLPSLLFPDAAVRMFNYMWEYSNTIKGLYETPSLPEVFTKNRPNPKAIHEQLSLIRKQGRTTLSEWESGRVLSAYGLPVVETMLAYNADEAVQKAQEIGFPVVLKLHSFITNKKRDLGGVKLCLETEQHVREAFEEIKKSAIRARGRKVFDGVMVEKMHEYRGIDMVIGSQTDEQFGAVLIFGNGGRIIELYDDKVVGLPPLNTTLAHRIMEKTHIYHAAKKYYDIPESLFEKVEQFMVRFSYLIAEQPLIKRVDINPVAVSDDELMILDAEIELHKKTPIEQPRLAIRPYPYEYEEQWLLKTGQEVFARPIRPDDEPLVVEFHRTLSDQSVYLRYFYSPSFDYRVSHERLARICFVDYDKEMAVVVLDTTNEPPILLAAGRTVKLRNSQDAEFALTVSDDYHGYGLGTKLLEYLIRLARHEHISRLVADVLPENEGMLYLCKKFGFDTKLDREEGVVKVWLHLE